MDKTQQVVSVVAICASILLAGMVIAYQPSALNQINELRFPVGVSASSTAYTATTELDTSSAPRTLSVSGTGVVNVKSDQAKVILGVYTEGKTAAAAIDENAALMTQVISALKALGITESNIKTTNYVVYPTYSWEIQSVIGYQVTNLIEVTITDLSKVGPVIDAASAGGSNRVDSISFGISDAASAALKLQAYELAIADAKAKSKVICDGLDVSITGVQSITESYYAPYIPYRSYAVAEGAGKSTTPILQGNLSVTVTLNIVYLIE